jgi:hypothetical protein
MMCYVTFINTYLMYNKRDPSFINLEIQSRFTETAYKRGVNRLASSSRNKNYIKKIYLGFGLSNLRTIEHSNYRTIGPLDYWTFGLSDHHRNNQFPLSM